MSFSISEIIVSSILLLLAFIILDILIVNRIFWDAFIMNQIDIYLTLRNSSGYCLNSNEDISIENDYCKN